MKKIFTLFLMMSFRLLAGEYVLVAESGTYSAEEIQEDSKNNIPVFREKSCIEGDFELAAIGLSAWADRQFVENDVTVEDQTIQIKTFYRRCEEYQVIGSDAGMPDYMCIRFSERIPSGNYEIRICD